MPPTNRPNAVMSMRTVPRFIHHITAKEAEQLLLTKGIDGSFLVRTSTNDPNVYALSYRNLNKVVHIKFETTEEGFTAKNLPYEYPTIGELIWEVQQMVPGLDYPLWPSDPSPDGLEPRLFFGRLATKHAERLLLDPDAQRERNFLLRSSTTYQDQIVISVRLPTGEVVHVLTHRRGSKFFTKGRENGERIFDNMKALMDHYMDPKNDDFEQEDGTIIKLIKPMVCQWNKNPGSDQPGTKGSPPSSAKSSSTVQKHIADEFEILQSDDCSMKPQNSEIGRRPENIPRNRYKNILPYDATRVKLDPPQDYINANYLKTDERLGQYIGCQGPLQHTVLDFWRMIWQEKCRFIVMLTNTVEAGKNKCYLYWPKDEGKELMYEQFVIKFQEKVSSTKDYTITKLRLINGSEEMPVFHCHYTGWPDKSVPKNIGLLVNFSQEILGMRNLVGDRRPGPIVAHCSAGIGRTGTYVLISMIIDNIQMFGVAPNILNFSKTLRQQRPGMVQTLQQYDLVHKATELYRSSVGSEPPSAQYGNMAIGAGNVVYGNINFNESQHQATN